MKNSVNNIDCIIPAAGLSSRMGCWKLMLPYNSSTILEQSIRNALSFCSRVILVVGHREEELIRQYSHWDNVTVIRNKNYKNGMFSSIQTGIHEVNTEYFFICHGDMPCVSGLIYQSLYHHRFNGTVFPGNKLRTGHPVLIHKATFDHLYRMNEAKSMKSILQQGQVRYLSLTDPSIYLDVDTPEAYEALVNTESVLDPLSS
ncbi:molybdenum cofactor cytidylyltransferase [Vibrio hangzhouensis]|uniref:molybdenum cofactor cytidylyltransferase n=1 Tax=Vibrio hangzhouensis TaxID=462991 RepID=UPI001C97F514|nr:molybdenum cofactor cytidylyltransferase [Vibrio hangzhouensis]MBY6196321.1 molybdenum cofactor cytidylyltransferase [Vibrio hangzhouensis]